MKFVIIILSFFIFSNSYTQSIEEAQILFNNKEYQSALDVLKECKKTEEVEILKAKNDYFLNYVNYACENLKLINTKNSLSTFDTLCNVDVAILNLPKAKNGDYYFEEVITIDEGIPAQDLFTLVKEWFVLSFDSLHTVVRFIDEENLKIIGSGKMDYNLSSPPSKNYSGYFEFIITFECRDDRFKYKIEKIEHQALNEKFSLGLNFENNPIAKKHVKSYLQKKVILDFQQEFEKLIETIRNIKPIKKEEDNW